MFLKDFYLEIWRPPVQWSRTIYQILKRAKWRTFMLRYMKIGPVVQEEIFKENVYGLRATNED